MSSKVHEETLKIIIAQMCQNIGFQGIFSSSLDVLVDLLHRYLKEIAVTTHRYSEQCGRTIPNLDDLGLAFQEMGISIADLEEYVSYVEPISFPHKVPKLPLSKPSNLNFLKPGAREILCRPLHVHEHLPPMYPEKEEEEINLSNGVNESENKNDVCNENSLPLQENKSIDDDVPVSKKVKLNPEEEGEPVREIDSVMMTTSGYISSAREGKMPEPRKPSVPMPLLGGNAPISKSPSLLSKKKVTMEKIIRHKSHQGGILAGTLAKPKVKHMKKKPKIPLAPPGTGSLKRICSPTGGQAPKLKIPNMNKDKEPHVPVPEKEPEKKKEKKKEGKEKKKKDKSDSNSSSKKRKEERRETKSHSSEKKRERTRIRMRGLSKEEELRRYKERENELIAALAASSAVTVTSIPPPHHNVREKSPDKLHPDPIPKNKLSVFRKFPKGPKEGERDSSPDLTIDAPVVKEEKPSPPPSPPPDMNMFHENPPMMGSLPSPTPKTPEIPPPLTPQPYQQTTIPVPIPVSSSKVKEGNSPHKIKKEKNKEKKMSKKRSPQVGIKSPNVPPPVSPTWGNSPDFPIRERPLTPEIGSINPPENLESSSIYNLPPFPHGPSLIPPPLSRFPFIPPFGVPPRPPIPDLNMFMRSPPPPPIPEKQKHPANIDNLDIIPQTTSHIEERAPSPPNNIPITINKPIKPCVTSETSAINVEVHHPERIPPENVKPEKVEKDKKREHKKDKKEKEKEKMKKKKDKKEREKKEKEDKKKEKERLKKERKEKKKIASTPVAPPTSSTAESVPKITLKFQNENESNMLPPYENKVMPKLVIKPLPKHSSNETQFNSAPPEKSKKKKNAPLALPPTPTPPLPVPQPSSSPPPPPPPTPTPIPVPINPTPALTVTSVKSPPREPPGSPPEIAKFVPLVTRPPKGSQNRKNTDQTVSSLKVKENLIKDIGNPIKAEPKESTVPPLKIKSTRANSPVPTHIKFPEEKKSSSSKKLEKKEKKKSSSLVVTSLAGLEASESTNVTIPGPSQLPPPIPIPSDSTLKSSSKKNTSFLGSSSSSSQGKLSSKTTGLLTETVGPIGHFVDDQGNEVWICPTCGKQDDGSPMIGCDTCDDWYHWLCVGIHVPPSERENWYCPRCLSQHKQQQGRGVLGVEKKKRGRKKKVV